MKTELVGEDEKTYTMHDGKSPFRVPKKGLSEEMHAKIRALGKKMAEGGLMGAVSEAFMPHRAPEWDRPVPIQTSPETLAAEQAATPEMWAPPALGQVPGLGGAVPQAEPTGAGMLARPADMPQDVAAPAPAPAAAPVRPSGASGVPAAPKEDAADKASRDAAQQQYEAAQQLGAAQAGHAVGQQKVLEQAALAEAERSRKAEDASNADMAKIQETRDAAKNMDMSVDTGHFWASRSTAGKLAGIVGLVLGSIGAGRDGINHAAGLINQAIDRDIEAQKAQHELKFKQGQADVEAAKGLYGMHRQLFADQTQAANAAKGTALDLEAQRYAQAAAKASDPAAKAQLMGVNAALLEHREAKDTATKQQSFQNSIELQRLGLEKQKIAAEMAKNSGTEFVSPGYSLVAGAKPKPEELGAWRQALASRNMIETQSKQLKGLIDSGQLFTGENSGKAEGIVSDLKIAMKDMAKLGALSGSDYALLDAQIPDPTKLRSLTTKDSTMKARLDQLVKNTATKFDAHTESLGIVKGGGAPTGGAGGEIRRNPKTGQKIQLVDGRWVPVQ